MGHYELSACFKNRKKNTGEMIIVVDQEIEQSIVNETNDDSSKSNSDSDSETDYDYSVSIPMNDN